MSVYTNKDMSEEVNFDTVKENIQPLRQGRNAERLGIALNAENQEAIQNELLQQRRYVSI